MARGQERLTGERTFDRAATGAPVGPVWDGVFSRAGHPCIFRKRCYGRHNP